MTYKDLEEWLRIFLTTPVYKYQYGEFSESPTEGDQYFCVLRANSGPAPVADDRTKRFTVIIIGRRQNRTDGAQMLADAEKIMRAAMGEIMPCGAAGVRALSEPVGPGYSNENRPFMQIEIQIIF